MPELLVSYLVSMCCQEQIGLIMSHKVPVNLWESTGIYWNLWEFPGISGIPKAISWSREFPPPSRNTGRGVLVVPLY
jgi:hypothetical protein